MGSLKIKTKGQSQSHITSAFMWYFLKKKTIKTWYIDVYTYINVYIVNYIYKQIHIKKFFRKFCTAL